MPDTGSALDEGQRPLAGFFLVPHPPSSPFAVGGPPLICGLGAGIVGVADDEDVMVDDEFER